MYGKCKNIERRKKWFRDYSKLHHKKLTPKVIYGKYKNNAKKRNLQFLISFEEFVKTTNKCCEYCGGSNKIGIDRTDNNIGYIKNNIVPCCSPCNYMKGKMSKNLFITQCQKISIKTLAPFC